MLQDGRFVVRIGGNLHANTHALVFGQALATNYYERHKLTTEAKHGKKLETGRQ